MRIRRIKKQAQPSAAEKFSVKAYALNMLTTFPKMIADMKKERSRPLDTSIVLIVAFLGCFGLLMIWSASMYSEGLAGDEFALVRKQLIFMVLAFAAMYIVSLVNYRYTKAYVGFLMLVILILLALVLGQDSFGGASRWFKILGMTMQPSEFAKIIVLLYMSSRIERHRSEIGSLRIFALVVLFCGAISLIIIKQPALSTGITVAALIIGMYFMAGGNLGAIGAMIAAGAAGVAFFIKSSGWRSSRVAVWLDPWAYFQGDGWQPAQSLMALGSGGLFGVGIGNGRAKLLYLPELQNDYIFSVIGEELGLIGCAAVLCVYFVLIYKLMKLSFAAPDTYARMLTSGYSVLLALQVALNVAVVTNSIPSTGVMLPFISSGGSSLLALMLGLGVVMNVSRHVVRVPAVTEAEE